MKNIITKIFAKVAMVACLATAFAGSAWATPDTEEITFPTSSANTDMKDSGVSITGTNVSVLASVGTGSNLATNTDGTRVYNGNTIVFSSSTKKIAKIEFTYKRNKKQTNGVSANTGSFTTAFTVGDSQASNLSAIWEASNETTTSVTFTVGSGSGNYALQSATVTFVEESSTTPSITADNVDIAYSATGGSIAYTVNNSVDGGTVSAAVTAGDWVTLGSGTASPISFTCSANSENSERTATVTLTYTYNTNETVTKDVTITQTAAPVVYSTIPTLFAAATSTETNVLVTFDSWVVSGVSTNGKNVFVTDNNGNGFVIFDNNGGLGDVYSAGDILSGTAVSCKLVLYNGFAEIKNLNASDLTINSSGTVSAANVAMANLAGVNTGALVSYSNLTCTVTSGKYYLSDGTTTLQVFNSLYAFDALVAGKTYNITGVYQQYNSTKEILPRSADDIVLVVSATPSIDVDPATINATAAETSGTVTVAYNNITTVAADIVFYTSSAATATTSEPDWISTNINSSNNLEYLIEENTTTEARTTYLKVWAYDDDLNEVYSDLITISQAAPVVAYATLPFAYDGNGTGTLPNGFTVEGLSTYNTSPKMQFNGNGDYAILQINERPGILTFDIKGNSFSGGTFKVQTSEDGITYSDLETYTELGATQSESFDDLGENIRYIKWIYTNKSSGNVALGNIALAAYVAPSLHTVSWTAGANTELFVFAGDQSSTIDSGDEVVAGTTVWVSVDVDAGYVFESLTVKDADDNDVVLTEETAGSFYSFTMPASNVTITSSAVAAPPVTGDQYELFTGTLVEGDYIIYYDGKAMNTTVTNDRLQYEEVTPSNNIITTDNVAIVWHIAQSGEYWTIYNADADAYAAGTGAKSKAQMLADGTDDKALWTITAGTDTYEFINKQNAANSVNATLRNNGTYGFACYATTTGGKLSLYKLVATAPQDEITINATALDGKCYATFYNGTVRYTLPAGAKAYTMNASHQLYLLGDGSEIPANTAVIIIADSTSITLKKSTKTDTVTVSDTNILVGSDSDVAKTGSQYVLGIKGGVLNFYKFNGTVILAGHAYYNE